MDISKLHTLKKDAKDKALEYDNIDSIIYRFGDVTRRQIVSYAFRKLSRIALKKMELLPTPVALDSNKIALIVEPYINYQLKFAVINVMQHLGNEWSIQIHLSKWNYEYTKAILKNITNISYVIRDDSLGAIWQYSNMMRSATFWKSVSNKNDAKILVFQSDCVMISNSIKIDEFLHYDYVGAPFATHNGWVLERIKNKEEPIWVGNGGFSLRSLSAMISICSTYGESSNDAEDVFFSLYMHQLKYNVPTRKQAYRFSREEKIPEYEMDPVYIAPPLALHATWVYYDKTEVGLFMHYALKEFL